MEPDEDAVTIETPEGVELRLVLANAGSRILAGALDEAIRYAVIIAAILVFAGLELAFTDLLAEDTGDGVPYLGLAVIVLTIFALTFFYDVLFEVLANGRTPGKMAVGIRVVQTAGEPMTLLPSAIRNLLRLVDQLPVLYGAGITSILVTRRNQRLGDLAAGTLVVRDRRARDARVAKAGAAPAWGPLAGPQVAGLASWDVSALSREDVAAIRHFLVRREALDAAPRERIAEEMAGRIRSRVAGAPADLDAETFLELAAAAKTARMG